jgi:hypothetical protein
VVSQAARRSVPRIAESFHFTREFQLLVACSWIAPDSQKAAQLGKIAALCGGPIDWEAFLSLVDRHKLAGIAHATLLNTQAAGKTIPDSIRNNLKEQRLRSWSRSVLLASELVRLNKAFVHQAVELLPLKGITLSLRLFNDAGMRHLRDLDILVRPEGVDSADEILKREGYRRLSPEYGRTEKRRQMEVRYERHREYYNDDLSVLVELHWRIEMLSPEKVAALWSYSWQMDWQGTTIRTMRDEALTLTVCDHGSGHRFSRLKWLSDSVMMLAVTRPLSEEMLKLAQYFDMERSLAQVAILACWLYDLELPDTLQDLVRREKFAVRMAARAIDTMLGTIKSPNNPSQNKNFLHYAMRATSAYVTSIPYEMAMRKRSPLRVTLDRNLVRAADFTAFPLPDKLIWLYYPLRPIFWILRRSGWHHRWSRSKPVG